MAVLSQEAECLPSHGLDLQLKYSTVRLEKQDQLDIF